MKLFAILCTLLVASEFQANCDNALEKMIKKALEVVREDMKIQASLPIPPISPMTFKGYDGNVDITLQISQTTVSKASNFVVNKISINLFTLHSEFGMSFPTIHVQGNYEVSGRIFHHGATGRGKFTVDVTDLVFNGELHMMNVNYIHLVESNSLNYTFQDIKVTQTGFEVEGMTDQQMQNFFAKEIPKLLLVHEPEVSQQIAQQVMHIANRFLESRTSNDLIIRLKNFIDAGPHCSDLLKAELKFHSINSTSTEILSSRLISDLSKLLKEKKFF